MFGTFGTAAAEAVGFSLWGEELTIQSDKNTSTGHSGPHVHQK